MNNILTICSLNCQDKQQKNLESLSKFVNYRCIIYRDVNANPGEFIAEVLDKPPSDIILFIDNQQIISDSLFVKGTELLENPEIKFVYSDGYLVGKYKQRLYLPSFRPNLLKYNKLVINMPLLVKPPIKFAMPRVEHLHLFSLFQQLCRYEVGYHLAEPTFYTTNFSTDISKELELLNKLNV